MHGPKTKTKTTAATFGAALAAMYAAPELQADVIDLGFNPGSIAFNTGSATLHPVDIVGVGGSSADFSQWNDSVGRTMVLGTGAISSFGVVQASQTLNASSIAWSGGFNTAASASGSAYIGFHTTDGNVGWFQISFSAFAPIVYGPGQYGNEGESVHVGTVPAPAGLAVLALGAVGVRRNRKRVA